MSFESSYSVVATNTIMARPASLENGILDKYEIMRKPKHTYSSNTYPSRGHWSFSCENLIRRFTSPCYFSVYRPTFEFIG